MEYVIKYTDTGNRMCQRNTNEFYDIVLVFYEILGKWKSKKSKPIT